MTTVNGKVSTGDEAELKSLRNFKFITAMVVSATVSLSISIIVVLPGKWGEIPHEVGEPLSAVFRGIFVGLLGASLIHLFKEKTTGKNLKDEIKGHFTSRTDDVIYMIKEEFRHQELKCNMFSPERVYLPINDEFNEVIDHILLNVSHFDFMSTTANYFLKMRLPHLIERINRPLSFRLLLHDPTDDFNLQMRVEQMIDENSDIEDTADLKIQVITSVIRTFFLTSKNACINFDIRLHREFPLCRLEFAGDHDLFLSYHSHDKKRRKIERGKGKGPVAHYKKNNQQYIFNLYHTYFKQVWDTEASRKRKFAIDSSCNFTQADLLSTFGSKLIDEAIKNICSSTDESENEIKLWLRGKTTDGSVNSHGSSALT